MVLEKRRRRTKMVALTIAMLVSHDTTTKGGGLPWFTFSIYALPFEIWLQTWGASMHWERNKHDCFKNLIEMILEIHEIALLTRATPGSSLVLHNMGLVLIFWKQTQRPEKFKDFSGRGGNSTTSHVKPQFIFNMFCHKSVEKCLTFGNWKLD